MLTLEERGAWLEIINAMWFAKERGKLVGTVEELGLLLGCYTSVTEALISKFDRLNICEVERGSNGLVTLSSRRMVREESTRKNTRARVQRFREKRFCNGHVTLQKSEVRSQKSERYKEDLCLVESEEEEQNCRFAQSSEADRAPKVVSAKRGPLMSADTLEELKSNPAYSKIDVTAEAWKFRTWCEVNRKSQSKRRFVNWLNRI